MSASGPAGRKGGAGGACMSVGARPTPPAAAPPACLLDMAGCLCLPACAPLRLPACPAGATRQASCWLPAGRPCHTHRGRSRCRGGCGTCHTWLLPGRCCQSRAPGSTWPRSSARRGRAGPCWLPRGPQSPRGRRGRALAPPRLAAAAACRAAAAAARCRRPAGCCCLQVCVRGWRKAKWEQGTAQGAAVGCGGGGRRRQAERPSPP